MEPISRRLYELHGNATKMLMFGDMEFDEYDETHCLRSDAYFQNEDAWDGEVRYPVDLVFRAQLPEDRRIKPEFLDGHAILMNHDPKFGLLSANTLVSGRAAEALSNLSNEFRFVPCRVEGAPFEYFIFWITNVVDIVDRRASRLDEYPIGTGKYWIKKAAFNDRVDGIDCCARPPLIKYHAVKDYVTDVFKDAVKKARLTGFFFVDPATKKEVR